MGTDLQVRSVVVPHTGEVVSLDAPPEVLASLLDEVKDVESQLRELKAEVSRVVHEEMDRQRRWTLDAGPFKLVGKSDAPEVVYDVERLAAVLTELVDDGTITTDAMDSALEVVTTYKVKKAGINALRKSPRLAEAIDSCGEERAVEGRRLTVKRP